MLKILVAEDSERKASKILRLLQECPGISSDYITIVDCIIEAKKLISTTIFDLLLLDIQLPNRREESPLQDGGIKLYRSILENPNLHMPRHIIGITAYDDILESCQDFFSDRLRAIIKYDETSSDWSDKLSNKLTELISAYHEHTTYDYDIGIICALFQPELRNVLMLPCDWSPLLLDSDSTIYHTGYLDNGHNIKIIAASAPQMGMPATAVLATKMISSFRPKYVAMCGITAGVSNQCQIGDILIATQTWDYGSGKRTVKAGKSIFKPDPQHISLDAGIREKLSLLSSDRSLLDNIKNLWPATPPITSLRAHLGPIASGSAVLSDVSIVKEIISYNRKLIGIDMEAYSLYYSAHNSNQPRPVAFSMKAVTDYADIHKDDDTQDYAAFVSAQFLYQFINKYL